MLHTQPTKAFLAQWTSYMRQPCAYHSTWTCTRQRDQARTDTLRLTSCLKRGYSTRESGVRNIAVLGGGITGLTTTYLLADTFPKVNITLYERGHKLGGWVRSKNVDVGDGEVIFEQGPRSLRPAPPNGTLAMRMIQDLGLAEDLTITPKSSPAARNRYVYYPDHLVRMPGPAAPGSSPFGAIISNLMTTLREPIFNNVFRAIFNDAKTEKRDSSLQDESVGDFISRRFHPDIAKNIVSAIFHGIYAGDIWKLSAERILPQQWRIEEKYGDIVSSLYDSAWNKQSWNFCDDIYLHMTLQEVEWDKRIRKGMESCSVFTFRHGLGQLTEALEKRLEKKKNVIVNRDTNVSSIEKQHNGDLLVTHNPSTSSSSNTTTHTHLVSTIPPKALLPLLNPASPTKTTTSHMTTLRRTIAATPSVTVMVVNLYYSLPYLPDPTTGDPLLGFGYLIPASVPFSQNTERALGVIFDSDVTPNLHTTVPPQKSGTKLTVMMGGHWWDGWTEFPDAEEARDMAMRVLKRHLGLTEEPVVCEANLQRDCIPQYTVGHSARMARGHEALLQMFGDRLRVAGSWYGGVGVNDCLRGAWEVVTGLAADLQTEEAGFAGMGRPVNAAATSRDKVIMKGSRTGLEGFKMGRPMVLCKRHKAGGIEVLEVEAKGKEMGFFEKVKVSEAKEQAD